MNQEMKYPRPSLEALQNHAVWLAFLLLAISLHVFEAALPNLGPWFKLGLANIMTLLALVYLGIRAAVTLAIARVIVGSIFIGTLFTPTFFISLGGATAAALTMLLIHTLFKRVSLITISLFAALAHMTAQFVIVELWFIQQAEIYYLLPPLLLLSLFSGWINGAIASYIHDHLKLDKKPASD